ncbi:hypothetical protein LRS10_04230 [Phenylobacterium sp. J426]|uniref:hypothetical protein n=1 Tax=Phenylobacterium sp. J426 TaxID=2898439 RepID=UPI002151F2F9|nr:hypothetical protein [Phenylobacterium sp. J426]MCR5873463.1 hypothetical protein [Phenylobacterium sp. J426]
MTRPPKKSEFLEVRIPHPTKEAFMARCREDGRSASEAVRAFIEAELAPEPRRRFRAAHVVAGALALAAAGAAAAPSLADSLRTAEFRALDANHDGVVSLPEYVNR